MDDFLGLGLIGVVYGLSVLVDAWGFLAVFFAAVALRQTELKLAGADMYTSDRRHTDRIESELQTQSRIKTPSPPSVKDR